MVIAQSDRRLVPQSQKLVCHPQKYRTSNGLLFWYNHDGRKVDTEDPDISLNFLRTSGWDSVMYIYLKLKSFSIQIGQKGEKPFPASVYQGPKHETLWEIGSLGSPLYFNKLTKNYSVHAPSGVSSQIQSIATHSVFDSVDQQEMAVSLISEILQKYNGNWIDACRGNEQAASVVILPELADKLARGEYVR
jgi:hypothetical protein